jgi:predicted transcriptional regulator
MRVLLSIKPEFALKIFDGSKRYEYRRAIFKHQGVRTIVVYASDPIKQVIGEFDIGDIIHDEPSALWAQTGDVSGITKKRFLEYFGNKTKGYAIEVKEARKYDIPVPIKHIASWAPQSFMYLS